MKKEKVYSLCEAVADITYIAAKENYETDDSREMRYLVPSPATVISRMNQHKREPEPRK